MYNASHGSTRPREDTLVHTTCPRPPSAHRSRVLRMAQVLASEQRAKQVHEEEVSRRGAATGTFLHALCSSPNLESVICGDHKQQTKCVLHIKS